MRYPKLRELKEAIRALIVGPFTTKFPVEPHIPYPRFRGKPVTDDEKCTGCMACANVCPAKAIEYVDDKEKGIRYIKRLYDVCIYCGQCEALCATREGIKMSDEYDLATLDRRTSFSTQEKELLVCPDCDRVVGTRHHMKWLARRLGPLAYGNLPLLQEQAADLGVSSEPVIDGGEMVPARADFFRILCPRCRHKIYLYDEYKK